MKKIDFDISEIIILSMIIPIMLCLITLITHNIIFTVCGIIILLIIAVVILIMALKEVKNYDKSADT